jgi:hypothetical protein
MSAVIHAAAFDSFADLTADWQHADWQLAKVHQLQHHMGELPARPPLVSFRLAFSKRAMHLLFRVTDEAITHCAMNDMDPVYRDSCVEFFLAPFVERPLDYINLELSCAGWVLAEYHKQGKDTRPFSLAECKSIGRCCKLDDSTNKCRNWTAELCVPFELIECITEVALQSPGDSFWQANAYKCASGASEPHWLCYAPIVDTRPNFHRPDAFVPIRLSGKLELSTRGSKTTT